MSGFDPRLPISTSSPSIVTMPRKPSHFGSYRRPPVTLSGSGTVATALASMGAMVSMPPVYALPAATAWRHGVGPPRTVGPPARRRPARAALTTLVACRTRRPSARSRPRRSPPVRSPPVEEVRPGVWTLAVPFRGGVPDATLVYVVAGDDGSLAVIDPGWSDGGELDVLTAGLRQIGRAVEDVTLIAVTHLHADHLGAAAALRRRSGAPIAMHPAEVHALEHARADAEQNERDARTWGVPDDRLDGVLAVWGSGRQLGQGTVEAPFADLELEDGDRLPIAGRDLRVLWTPGHTGGHVCFVDEPDGLLFTGDHVLPRINSGIGLGGRTDSNPLAGLARLVGGARTVRRVRGLPRARVPLP